MTHEWTYRHRRQHNAAKRGKATTLDPRTTKRFAAEFENALKQRGAEAKKAMEDARG